VVLVVTGASGMVQETPGLTAGRPGWGWPGPRPGAAGPVPAGACRGGGFRCRWRPARGRVASRCGTP